MSRFLGTETEYGIATPSRPELSPIVTSTHAVVAHAAMNTGARFSWDFEDEFPLRDARGFDLRRYRTVPVVDSTALGVANVVLDNGARFYVDHAHPEYSVPECDSAYLAMVYDAAGDLVLHQAAQTIAELDRQQVSVLKNHDPCPPLKIYKNNVDGKGASYGSHENYQYSRETDFAELAQALIPFFVCRQVVIGAGRVGIGEKGEREGFQISQRADYFCQEISLETTLNRGIINTRDEPHADAAKYGRLHVIIGDANMSQTSNLLKLGMTALVLDAIEQGVDFSDLALVDPVAELKNVSHDPTLAHRLTLKDGRRLTALEVLAAYRKRVHPADHEDRRVLAAWDEAVGLLGGDPLLAAGLLDWPTKLALVRRYLDRGVAAGDAKLKLIDLQYTDIDPERGLYHALVRAGRMRTLASDAEIARAVDVPPAGSRAFLRGRIVEKFAQFVAAASWQAITLALSDTHARVLLPETGRATRAEVGELVEQASTPEELVAGLERAGFDVEKLSAR
ncbi:proteasomal accessory factor [Corynebacterium atypicum]|uniref:Proteasomal accessory factor n=1 Tax=Corynebacterium atypicum TaxID=191610 RepID=A0ABM5QMY6_9CORY|nr:depupylase/deamidase Dop [Corynebacterium atypicum]AIG64135.1 proteasomal accessory factor [Corynebacterium atypicum]